MSALDSIMDKVSEKQMEILTFIHELLTHEFGLTDKVRYGIPFYYHRSWICYLNPSKTEKVELAFTRGNELSNSQGLLESKGRKQVFGIELTDYSEIPKDLLCEIIQEAILLDETKPYASKRQIRK